MATTIARLQAKVGMDTSGVESGAQRVRNTVSGLTSAFSALLPALGLGALSAGFVTLASDAARVEQTAGTFERLTQSVGGDATSAMEALRTATRGMVADTSLLEAGNQLLAMGLADSTDSMARQIEVATQLGSAMGASASEAAQSWALMNANMSIQRLDTFGISSGKVTQRINELTSGIDALSREEAWNIAVMEQAESAMARVGEQGQGPAASIARIQTSAKNAAAELGSALLPMLESLLEVAEPMATRMGEMFSSPEFQDGAERAAEMLGGVLDYITNLDPVAVKFATTVVGLAGAAYGLVTAFGAVKTGLVALNAAIAANPIGAIAVGIVAAGLGIAAVIDKIQKNQAEMNAEMERQTDVLGQTSSSYEQYLDAVGRVTIATQQLSPVSDRLAVAQQMVAEGAALTREAWEAQRNEAYMSAQEIQNYASAQSQAASASLSVILAEEKKAAAIEAANARANVSFGSFRQAAGEEYGSYVTETQQALIDAFASDAMAGQLQQNLSVIQQHNSAMAQLEQSHTDSLLNMEFNYNLQRAQAEQAYLQEHTALVAAGRMQDAADLTASHASKQEQAAGDYAIQQQMQERNLLVQQVNQKRAYIEQLQLQKDQSLRALKLQIETMAAERKIDQEAAKNAVTAIAAAGSAQLQSEIETERASLEAREAWASGTMDSFEMVAEGMAILNTAQYDAQKALEELQARLDEFEIELPALPALDMSAYTGSFEGAGGEVGESATRELASVVSDIERAVDSAQSAIEGLAELEVPATLEADLGRLREFTVAVVTEMYDWLPEIGDQLAELDAVLEPIQGVGKAIAAMVSAATAVDEYDLTSPIDEFREHALAMLERWQAVETLFSDMVTEISDTEKTEIANYTSAVSAVSKATQDALKALTAIDGWETVGDIEDKARALAEGSRTLVEALGTAAAEFSSRGLAATEQFASAVEAVSKGMSAALAILSELPGYTRVPVYEVNQFQLNVMELFLTMSNWAEDVLADKALETTEAFSSALDALGGGMLSAFEILSELPEYARVSVYTVNQFQFNVMELFLTMHNWAAGRLADEALATTEAMGSALDALAGGMLSALEILSELDEYTRVSVYQVNQFQFNVMELFLTMHNWAVDTLEKEALATTEAMGAALDALGGGLLGALEVLNGLRYYTRPTERSMDQFIAGVESIMERAKAYAQRELDSDTATLISEYGSAMEALVGGMDSALSFATKLDELPGLNTFDRHLQHFNTLLMRMLTSWRTWFTDDLEDEAWETTQSFSQVVAIITENMGSALGFLHDLISGSLPSSDDLREFIGTLLDTFRGFGSDEGTSPASWYSLGLDYAQNLADGLTDGQPLVQDAIGGLASSMIVPVVPRFDIVGPGRPGPVPVSASGGAAPVSISVNITGTFNVNNDENVRRLAEAVTQQIMDKFARVGGRMA